MTIGEFAAKLVPMSMGLWKNVIAMTDDEHRRDPRLIASRRSWLLRSIALSASLGIAAGRARAADDAAIVQPEHATPEAFIARAFEMRARAEQEGDQPYGAIVVRDGRIVGEAPSRVVTRGDPTAHAEIEAIRDAARRLGTRDLAGCIMYSSSPPCPMCEAAAYWARIARLVHGAAIVDGGPPRLTRC